MGRSFLLGNSGFIGRDRRDEAGSTGGTGNVSVRKHFLERKQGNLVPGCNPNEPNTQIKTGVLYQEDWDDFVSGDWFQQPDGDIRWQVSSVDFASGGTAGLVMDNPANTYTYDNGTDVHLWVDLYIPAEVTNMTLDFDWKCDGESSFDYGYVWITNSGDTVTATPRESADDRALRLGGDSSVSTGSVHYRRYNSTYNTSADLNWVSEPTISLSSGATQSGEQTAPATFVPGDYNRFYWSFTSDGDTINNPPFGVDNIVWNFTASTLICVDPNDPGPFN